MQDQPDWFEDMIADHIRHHYKLGAPKRSRTASSSVTSWRRNSLTLGAHLKKYHWRESNPLDGAL